MRSNSHARSAAQSVGFTSDGLAALASSALRSPIWPQRDANGVSIRRINISSALPLAAPHGCGPSPTASGSKVPAKRGSRRDASGYSTAIQQKYQGMLITETKLNVGGSSLPPGQYGFGFTADNKFMVMDVANSDVLSAAYQTDQALQHAVPLKLVEDGTGYKLYAGKKWIAIKAE